MKLRYRPLGLRPTDPLRGARDSLKVAGVFPPSRKNPGDAYASAWPCMFFSVLYFNFLSTFLSMCEGFTSMNYLIYVLRLLCY